MKWIERKIKKYIEKIITEVVIKLIVRLYQEELTRVINKHGKTIDDFKTEG